MFQVKGTEDQFLNPPFLLFSHFWSQNKSILFQLGCLFSQCSPGKKGIVMWKKIWL
jgi:hypothetical protein